MAVEKITLNLIPTGETPTIHAAQFDKKRAFQIELKEGEDDFSPSEYTIELQVRKVDNNIVTAGPSQVSSNIVTFLTTEQMTACSGTNLAELQISKNNMSIATLHFYLVVQRDVLVGGLSSQSEIYDLEEQIAAIVPSVIGDEYYTAEEVDEKIAEIPTFDPTNYYDKTQLYTKTETNGLLSQKANTSALSTVAFTGSYDDLSDKPTIPTNAEQLPIESGSATNTKDYIDDKTALVKSASGSLVHITDGADNIPVKSLVSEIVAVQDFNGYDKPWVGDAGKNKLDSSYLVGFNESGLNVVNNNGVLSITGNVSSAFNKRLATGVPIKAGTYIISKGSSNVYPQFLVSYNNKYIAYVGATEQTIIIQTDGVINIDMYTNRGNYSDTFYPMIRLSTETDSSFEPYSNICPITGFDSGVVTVNGNTYTFTFGQTVYGGHFDNKGNLVVTHGYHQITGTENWAWTKSSYYSGSFFTPVTNVGAKASIPFICTHAKTALTNREYEWGTCYCDGSLNFRIMQASDTVQDWKDYLASQYANGTPVAIVYELATPITLSITSQDIPTLLGENNIYSNCGDVEVEYFTSSADDIAELIRALM